MGSPFSYSRDDLPEGWNKRRLGSLLQFRNGQDISGTDNEISGTDNEFESYPVYGSGGEFERTNQYLFDGPSILFGRKGTIDKPLLVDGRFWTVDTMFYTVPGPDVDPRFVHYWALVAPLSVLSTNTAVPSMTSTDLAQLYLAVPPLSTQRAIADYLDRETAEIDGMRADLDEMDRLLTERRAAIVADLLLKNPSVVYVSLGLLFTLEDHLRIPVKAGDRKEMAGNVPYYGASGVIDYVSKPIWTDCTRLLVSEDGANLALRNHPIAFTASGDFWVNNHAHILRENQQHSYDLAASGISVTDISGFLSGSAQPKLTAESMSRIKVPWLNHPSQRRFLVTEIDRETAEIDSMLEDITKLRDLLAERRAAVISAAVTGQIDIPASLDNKDEPHA